MDGCPRERHALSLPPRKLTDRKIGEGSDPEPFACLVRGFVGSPIKRSRQADVLTGRQIGVAMTFVRNPADLPSNLRLGLVFRPVENAPVGRTNHRSKNSK